ncbi:lysine transporter LysE [Colwellia sp. MT41]|uniref:Lysine transporter LysE n=1 Tax=Colwellia marinimaniae TaxID=1513592 RepID=A0ABQ0MZH8_9GAMM|nr:MULTISPECIES: LysE family translocator [Colwellia]ALO34778.1 lysine transporter LysE [Colwellia sp. MT41]GAW97765.1 lysine transporter LysE [Colwellia marinimaniae]
MELFLAILLFAVSTSITPGPNNIMIMASGLNHGVKSSLPHLLGICFGFPVMVILVGLGIGVFFEMYPLFHEIIKIFGVIYLLYLSWLIALSSPTSLDGKLSKPFSFVQAALFQWVNPKAWVMAVGAVSAYTSLSTDVFNQVIYIALAFFVVSFPCVGVWLVFGSGLKKYLKSPKHQKTFNVAMALLLIGSVLPVLKELFDQYVA